MYVWGKKGLLVFHNFKDWVIGYYIVMKFQIRLIPTSENVNRVVSMDKVYEAFNIIIYLQKLYIEYHAWWTGKCNTVHHFGYSTQ